MARQMKDSGIEWIGEIPETWEVIPHKYVMHKEKSICEHHNGEDIISLTMNGVIVRDLTAGGKMPTTFDGYQYVEPEDMLLCLFDIDVTPRCVGIVRNHGVTSPAYSRFKVHEGYYNAYYDYLLRFIDDEKVFIHLSKNLRSSLTETDFGVIKTLAPSFAEQQRIAAFLDRKCAEIDAVIERTKATIEEYKKLKQAVITEAVTKGVRGPRPMKDSGIEWIGEIPEGWDIVKLKYFLSDDKVNLRVGPFGSALAGSDFVEEGEWVYNQRVVLDDNFISNDTFVSASKYAELAGFEVIPDDVLITTRGSIGKVAIVPQDAPRGILHPCIIKFRVNQDMIPHSILKHVFNDTDFVLRQIKEMSNSTTIDVLYSYSLRNVLLPLIPMCEQPEIAAYLDEKCAALDTLIAKKTALLTELETYKKSLIYEYVTGKKEIL